MKIREATQGSFDIYSFFMTFLICAFFGWCFETLTVFLLTGHITRRGLLFLGAPLGFFVPALRSLPAVGDARIVWGLPIIVVYGIGGLVISVSFRKFQAHALILFLVGAILMTTLELATSYFCDIVLGRNYWDYRDEILNFQGRICLRASMAWGLISLFTVKILIPKGYSLYVKERKFRHGKGVLAIVMAYTAVCVFYKYIMAK